MIVDKIRVSPSSSVNSKGSMIESVTSNSSSTDYDSGRDQILPMYSERSTNSGGQTSNQRFYYHLQQMTNVSPGVNTFHVGDDENDSFTDDISSTCSSRRRPSSAVLHSGINNKTSYYGSNSTLTVASEPYHHSYTRQQSQQLQQQIWGSQPSPDQSHSHSPARSTSRDAVSSSYYNYNNSSPQEYSYHQQQQQQQQLQQQSTLVFTATKRKNPMYLLVAGFCALGMALYTRCHATMHEALEQVIIYTEQRRKVHAKFDSIEQDIRRLQIEMMELTAVTLDDANANSNNGVSSLADIISTGDEELNVLQEKLKEGSSQIGLLQKKLQEIHKNDAILKYGSGKIRVELELEFPKNDAHKTLKDTHSRKSHPDTISAGAPSSSTTTSSIIVMEMAPLDMMPHSVYMFLEMVDAKLFDGCSFILNAMHVIKAAPLPYDGSSAAAKVRSFALKGLESVAFREYSPDYPHGPYTVGFAVDGSPSFYINTQDNTDVHVGEPCFAKIISGFETVQRMEQAPTRNGIWYRQRIGIKKATIL
jgi:cyclophilin family peptidyl-prolyl cis-trans isomerase